MTLDYTSSINHSGETKDQGLSKTDTSSESSKTSPPYHGRRVSYSHSKKSSSDEEPSPLLKNPSSLVPNLRPRLQTDPGSRQHIKGKGGLNADDPLDNRIRAVSTPVTHLEKAEIFNEPLMISDIELQKSDDDESFIDQVGVSKGKSSEKSIVDVDIEEFMKEIKKLKKKWYVR